MNPDHAALPDAQVLADLAWVRRLARRLLADPSLADDVAQEAWLAARRDALGREARSGAWLVTVVKNHIRRLARTDRRRAAREAAHAELRDPGAAAADPADIVERAALHRELMDAVMALEEPYRSAVLLRHLDELPATEVARRQGVSHDAARKRISRGLQLLRERLEHVHRGGLLAWSAAWSHHLQSGAAASATGSSLLLPGFVLMNLKWILASAAALGSLLTWLLWSEQQLPVGETVAEARPAAAADGGQIVAAGPSAAAERQLAAAAPEVVIEVVDVLSRACAGALVMTLREGELVRQAVCDASGQARLPVGAGVAEVLVAQPGTIPLRTAMAAVDGRQRVVLGAGLQVAGEVRFADGQGAAPQVPLRLEHDRPLVCWAGLGEAAQRVLGSLGVSRDALLVTTQAGHFACRGLSPRWTGALVATGGYTLRDLTQRGASDDGVSLLLLEPVDDLSIELQQPLLLRGRLLAAGKPAAGMQLDWLGARDRPGILPSPAHSDGDGRFELGARRDAEGRVGPGRLLVQSQDGQLLLSHTVQLTGEGSPVDLGDLELGRPLAVQVQSAGVPLSAATVSLVGEATGIAATTDASGLARFVAVPAAVQRVVVQAPGHRRVQLPLPIEPELQVELDAANELVVRVLAADGAGAPDLRLQVRADRLPFVLPAAAGAAPAAEPFSAQFELQAGGELSLMDLVPGVLLRLAAIDELGAEVGALEVLTPPALRRDEVVLRTTYAPCFWRGVVRDEAGREVPRVRVYVETHGAALQTRTDSHGRFSLGPFRGDLNDLHVEVTHPLFVSQVRDGFAIDPRGAEADIVLQRGRQLRARVLQQSGAPVTATTVYVGFEGGGGAVGAAREPGEFVFDNVARLPGTLTVPLGGREFTAVVTAHDDLVELRVPDLAAVSIGLADSLELIAGTRLCVAITPIEPAGNVDRIYFPAADAAAKSLPLQLPAGRYRLQLERRRFGRRGAELLGEAREFEFVGGEVREVVLP